MLVSALVGGVLALITMIQEGSLLRRLTQLLQRLYCFIFTRQSLYLGSCREAESQGKTIPYGVALSLGVIIVYLFSSLDYTLPGFS